MVDERCRWRRKEPELTYGAAGGVQQAFCAEPNFPP